MKILVFPLLIMTLKIVPSFAQSDSPFYSYEGYDLDSVKTKISYFLIDDKDTLFRRERIVNGHLQNIAFLRKINSLAYVGSFTDFYPSGVIQNHGQFNDNHYKIGIWKSYHQNGNLESKVNLKDGLVFGKYAYSDSTKQILLKGRLKILSKRDIRVNSKIGTWISYHNNGRKESKGKYWFRELIEYSEKEYNAILRQKGFVAKPMYKTNIKHGRWKYWNENNELMKTEIYNKGKLINKTQ